MRQVLVVFFIASFALTFAWHFTFPALFADRVTLTEAQILPSQVLAARKLLNAHGVSEFMASKKIWEWEGGHVLQRMGEGLYPLRLVLHAPSTIAFATEAVPTGCTRLGREEDVQLVRCGG